MPSSVKLEFMVEVVFEVWLEIVLKINFHGWGWLAGSIETKAISASNLKLKLTEAELGNNTTPRRILYRVVP